MLNSVMSACKSDVISEVSGTANTCTDEQELYKGIFGGISKLFITKSKIIVDGISRSIHFGMCFQVPLDVPKLYAFKAILKPFLTSKLES